MPLTSSAQPVPSQQIGRRRHRIIRSAAATIVAAALYASSPASALGASAYWDTNGTTAGAVNTAASPANGTWGVNPFWSSSTTGTLATGPWIDGDTAVFSAGMGISGGLATGANTITVSGSPIAAGLIFEEGTNTFNEGTIILQGAAGAPGVITIGVPGNTQVFNSAITGQNGITINRSPSIFSGAVTFNSPNTFLGSLVLASGRLNINNDAAASTGPIVLNLNTTLSSTAITNSIITLANPFTINGGVGNAADISSNPGVTLILNGKISGSGNWQHGAAAASPGTLVLTNIANDFTGAVTVTSGTLLVTADHVLGAAGAATPLSAASNTAISFTGQVAFQSAVSTTYSTAEQLIINANVTGPVQINNLGGDNIFAGGVQFNSAAMNTIGVDGGSLTLAGQIIAASAGNKPFTKAGRGTLTLTGENTTGFNSGVTVNGGTLALAGTTATAGDIASATAITVNNGATLLLDNSTGNNQDRLGDSATLALNGSHLLLKAANENTIEQFGDLAVNPGEGFVSTVTAVPALDGAALIGGGFTRGSGALALFRAPGLGSAAAAGVGQIKFNTAPTLAGAGGTGFDKSIIAGALGDTSITGSGTELVTYDATNGVTPLAPADYASSITSGSSVLNNVAIDSAQSISADTAVNSIKFSNAAAGIDISSGTLTVNSGMILANVSSDSGISGSGTLAFPTGVDGVIAGGGDLTISANINAPAALVKAGSGKLTLNGTNTLSTLYISGGSVIPSTTAALSTNSVIHVGGGGTLELPDGMNLTSSDLFLHDGGRLLGRGNSSFSRDLSPHVSDGATVIVQSADPDGVLTINSLFKGTATAANRPTISLRGPGKVDFVPPTGTFFGNFELRDGVTVPLRKDIDALGNIGNSLIFGPGGGTVLMNSERGGTPWDYPVVINGDATFKDLSTNGTNRFASITVNTSSTIKQVLDTGLNFIDPGIDFGNALLNASPTFDVPRPPIAGSYGRVTITNVRELGAQRGITKLGEGILHLNGSVQFSGVFNVNEGVVFMTDSVPTLSGLGGGGILIGSVNMKDGADIAPGYNGVGTLLVEGITINGTEDNKAQLHMEGDATGFDQLFVFGQEKFKLNGPAVIDLTNLGGLINGDYVLIDYLVTPLSDTDFAKLSLASTAFGAFTASLINDTEHTQVKLHLEGGPNSSIWNVDTDGSWNDVPNWDTGIVPNAGIDSASFFAKITAPRTITLDGDQTVAQLNFNNANRHTIAPGTGGKLTLGTPTSSAVMNVTSGSHAITAPLAMDGSVLMNIAAGTSLDVSGGLSIGAGKIATMRGAGTLNISGPQSHGVGARLAVNAGRVNLNSNAGTPATADAAAIATLAVNLTSTDTRVVLNADQDLAAIRVDIGEMGNQSFDLNSPAAAGEFRSVRIYAADAEGAKAALYGAIRNANVDGAPSPTDGIYDSGIAAHSGSLLGVAALVDAHGDPYVLMRPTRIGDLNLDGAVTISDFIDLASNFNVIGTATWQEGDLNYDGSVTISDFIDLASNFNTTYAGETFAVDPAEQQLLTAFAASHGAAVPEPATLGLLGGAAVLLLNRRRRKS